MKIDLNHLFHFESKYNLKERTILNVKYWDFLRMHIFYIVKSRCNGTQKPADLKKTVKIKDIKLHFNLFTRYFISKKDKVDILFITDPRRTKEDDKYISVFIDPYVNAIKNDYKTMILEEPNWCAWGFNMPAHFYPTINDNIKYVDLFEINYKIKRYAFLKLFKTKVSTILNELIWLNNCIKKEFNISIHDYNDALTNIITYFLLMEKKYTKLIKKINPKIVLLNYRPTNFKVLVNSICRKNGIKTVDIQHGVITENDPLDRKNPNGFDFLSTSDYLFSFGRKLTNTNNLCFPKNRIKYIGFQYLESKTATKLSVPNIIMKNKKYILIISQSICGNDFANFASDLSILLSHQKEYVIIFKYHPNELYKNYECLKKKNILEVKDLEYSIYQFQQNAICQIGAYSTALFEGLRFGIPTMIINYLPGAAGSIDVMKHLSKGFYSISDANDVIKLINYIETIEKKDIGNFWESNSTEKFKNELDNILKND